MLIKRSMQTNCSNEVVIIIVNDLSTKKKTIRGFREKSNREKNKKREEDSEMLYYSLFELSTSN